jgi:tetratricopeptide (TPR) repeat protein
LSISAENFDAESKKSLKLLHGYRGLMLQSAGNQSSALRELHKAAQYDPADAQPHFLLAESYAALGQFKAAVDEFNHVLMINPDNHMAFFKCELVYYYKHRLDDPFFSFNTDFELDEALKFGLAKGLSVAEVGYPLATTGGRYSDLYASKMKNQLDVSITGDEGAHFADTLSLRKEDAERIQEMTYRLEPIAKWLQLDTPGTIIPVLLLLFV